MLDEAAELRQKAGFPGKMDAMLIHAPEIKNRRSPVGEGGSVPEWQLAGSAAQFAHALGGGDDVRQADAELVVHHHHFALGDEGAVDQYIHGFASQGIQFHH